MLLLALATLGATYRPADPDALQKKYLAGAYEEVAEMQLPVTQQPDIVAATIIKIRALNALGRIEEAFSFLQSIAARNPRRASIAAEFADALNAFGSRREARELARGFLSYPPHPSNDTAADQVGLGKLRLIVGDDPRAVINDVLEPARTKFPKNREPYLALGNLALEKHDFAMAADMFRAGLKQFPDDPEMELGLAKAVADASARTAKELLEKSLGTNPRSTDALLFRAEQSLAQDALDKVLADLEKALQVDRSLPAALALRAVVAQLSLNMTDAKTYREKALERSITNPEVDYLIGKKLAEHMRLGEALSYQRAAVELDPEFYPAKFELGLTLLRLGEEQEGWQLMQEVQQRDPYDVAAFNLVSLRDKIASYPTMEREGIRLRMSPKEMAVYGDRALALSARARNTLAEKYGVKITFPLTVEIFADQPDFAVRTFSMPTGEGFLGVCFGPLITACSPAARLGRANWEAVLWHEVCHTITLTATRYRIPRWLTEGISVYEEQQANPGWGKRMNSHYRELILKEKPVALQELDQLFRGPQIDFAYFQGSCAVEYIVKKYGFEALRLILDDLGKGIPIADTLRKRTAELPVLNSEFQAYLKKKAEELAPALDWTQPEPEKLIALAANPVEWVKQSPNNFWAMMTYAHHLVNQRNWAEAKTVLEKIVTAYPNSREQDNPSFLLAKVYRELGDSANERAVLERMAASDGDAFRVLERLIELALEKGDSSAAAKYGEALLGVNPLFPKVYRQLGKAYAALGDTRQRIKTYEVLLELEPVSAADTHYELAQILHEQHDPAAKLHLLKTLEAVPRFRDAQRLLVEMQKE